jgi:pyruvate dehydrogenase E2 component (dihydrolipoamide acetyltransferase)
VADTIEVLVPDIGGFKDVSVIDVLVNEGQQIDKETPLITIETEKAAMDVPAPSAGKIAQVKLKAGDKVSQGSLILLLEGHGAQPAQSAPPTPPEKPAAAPNQAAPAARDAATAGAASASPASAGSAPVSTASISAASASTAPASTAPVSTARANAAPAGAAPKAATRVDEAAFSNAYASPSLRKFARELGADLGHIKGTGTKGRITQEDVKAYVKGIVTSPPPPVAGGAALPKVAAVDFAAFGAVEVKPLSRIQKISGSRLQASWLNLPHVTQHEDADITDLEAARVELKATASAKGVRLTPLAFIVKACALALKEHPRFNASLDPAGENLIFKKYYNIGFAADTPNGLVVPVIANADILGIFDIARVLGEMSEKARAGKLKVTEMQGGTFTISSLGGIGGTAFTPIINAPEVAILGVSKSSQKPVYERGGFIPRLMLPLSLSYDHRVIDGAEAARFIVFLAKTLADVKALL